MDCACKRKYVYKCEDRIDIWRGYEVDKRIWERNRQNETIFNV